MNNEIKRQLVEALSEQLNGDPAEYRISLDRDSLIVEIVCDAGTFEVCRLIGFGVGSSLVLPCKMKANIQID